MQRLTRWRLVLAMAITAALPALAIQPFVIRDIRVEGVQRTEAGTVATAGLLEVSASVASAGIGAPLRV